jgi:hypothetical protein
VIDTDSQSGWMCCSDPDRNDSPERTQIKLAVAAYKHLAQLLLRSLSNDDGMLRVGVLGVSGLFDHSLSLADLCGETGLDGSDGTSGTAAVAGDEVQSVLTLVELGIGAAAGLAGDVFNYWDR